MEREIAHFGGRKFLTSKTVAYSLGRGLLLLMVSRSCFGARTLQRPPNVPGVDAGTMQPKTEQGQKLQRWLNPLGCETKTRASLQPARNGDLQMHATENQ